MKTSPRRRRGLVELVDGPVEVALTTAGSPADVAERGIRVECVESFEQFYRRGFRAWSCSLGL